MPSCCTCRLNRRRALSIDSPSKIRIAANACLPHLDHHTFFRRLLVYKLPLADHQAINDARSCHSKMSLFEGLYAIEIHSLWSFQLDQFVTRDKITQERSLTIYKPGVGKFCVKSNGESLQLQYI
jgi:hypothetical protein